MFHEIKDGKKWYKMHRGKFGMWLKSFFPGFDSYSIVREDNPGIKYPMKNSMGPHDVDKFSEAVDGLKYVQSQHPGEDFVIMRTQTSRDIYKPMESVQ